MQMPPPPTDVDDLSRTKRQLARWRSTRLTGMRIPDRIWQSAASLAHVHGLSCTARVLGLDYQRLKERAALAPPSNTEPPADHRAGEGSKSADHEAPPGFVEFALGGPPSSRSCVIEVEANGNLKLRLDLKGYAPSELDAILRTVWSPNRCSC